LDCISSVEDFKDSLRKEHTLGEDELLEKVKGGILNGFLELDEKLRKIPGKSWFLNFSVFLDSFLINVPTCLFCGFSK
jgi:hypothetical protein